MQGQVGLREAPRVPALCCSWSGDAGHRNPRGSRGGLGSVFTPRRL